MGTAVQVETGVGNMTGIAVELELSVENMTEMVRNLFSSIVIWILSEMLTVKEAVESSSGGSKLERNE